MRRGRQAASQRPTQQLRAVGNAEPPCRIVMGGGQSGAPENLPVPAAPARALHPLHAILLAFPVALFTAALAADIAYLNSAEMQWSNLAAWAITGALLLGAAALAWAAVAWLRGRRERPGRAAALYPLLLAAAWVCGLVNAFKHSQDAWSSVGAFGLILSLLSTALVLAAAWIAHSGAEYRR